MLNKLMNERTKQILIDTFCKLKHEALKVGLIVNKSKTKYLYCTKKKTIQPTYMDTGEEQFEQVNSFKYLGTMVNTDSSVERESKERIAAGNRAFHVHKKLFTSIQVREEYPICVQTQNTTKYKTKFITLLQHYNNMFRPKLSAIVRLYMKPIVSMP